MSRKDRLRKTKKRLAKIYAKTSTTNPSDVGRARSSIERAIAKRGHKVYRKDRLRTERFVNRLLEKHYIQGTCSENYWRLAFICQLIGPDPKIKKMSHVSTQKSRTKFRRKKHRRR